MPSSFSGPIDTVAYTTAIHEDCCRRVRFPNHLRANLRVLHHRPSSSTRETANIVSRRYPLDSPEPEPGRGRRTRQGWLADGSVAMRMAAASADMLLDIGDWRRRHADMSHALIGMTLLVLGLALGAAAAITDSYLHRGVESGAEQPYIVQPTGKGLATNIDFRSYSPEQL